MTRPLIEVILESYLEDVQRHLPGMEPKPEPTKAPYVQKTLPLYAGPPSAYKPQQKKRREWPDISSNYVAVTSPSDVAKSVLAIVRPALNKLIDELDKEIADKRPDFANMVSNAIGKFKGWFGKWFGMSEVVNAQAHNIISKYAQDKLNEIRQQQQQKFPLTQRAFGELPKDQPFFTLKNQPPPGAEKGVSPPSNPNWLGDKIWYPSPYSVKDSLWQFGRMLEELIYKNIVKQVNKYSGWLQGQGRADPQRLRATRKDTQTIDTLNKELDKSEYKNKRLARSNSELMRRIKKLEDQLDTLQGGEEAELGHGPDTGKDKDKIIAGGGPLKEKPEEEMGFDKPPEEPEEPPEEPAPEEEDEEDLLGGAPNPGGYLDEPEEEKKKKKEKEDPGF